MAQMVPAVSEPLGAAPGVGWGLALEGQQLAQKHLQDRKNSFGRSLFRGVRERVIHGLQSWGVYPP